MPVYDDRLLFEFLILEGTQAGLSWSTILSRRENYRRAFDRFDLLRVAQYDEEKIALLLMDAGIIRNRLKIRSAVQNARACLRIQQEFGSFSAYLWQFTGGGARQNAWKSLDQIPAQTPESQALSAALRQRGFKFVGPTICYAFMQAVGMVNDHVVDCFRYHQVSP